MSKRDLDKATMYEGVKLLVECPDKHIHLPQQKLYTLFAISFNYLLYISTKQPGHYIIRVEDSYLLEKLQRKSKDDTSRKFMGKLALPRKFKYGNSTFHLDFFSFSTWSNTNELPKDRIQAALIVKNATKSPIGFHEMDEIEENEKQVLASLPDNYYLTSLQDFVPKTVTVAFDEEFNDTTKINFPFIKEDPKEKVVKGVNIAANIDLDQLDD
jgi:hypothetical protein